MKIVGQPKSNAEFSLQNDSTPTLLASTGQRFATFILDVAFYYLFYIILGIIWGIVWMILGLGAITEYLDYRFGIFALLVYYTPQEAIFGRTLGKLITGTKAINDDGTKLTFGGALARTLCRCIPFDGLTFLFLRENGCPRGWHDSIPKTKVISIRKNQ